MGLLAGKVDFVVGVDTHKKSHTASVVDPTGAQIAQLVIAADASGYRRVLHFGCKHAPGRRVWAIEGSGSFGSGLSTYLLQQGEWIVEVARPARPARRNGAKSDELDATRAAREALARKHLAQPRQRGDREALRVLLRTRQGAVNGRTRATCYLNALLITAPDGLRRHLRRSSPDERIVRCARLRTRAQHSVEHRATVIALRSTARRIMALEQEANDLESQIQPIVSRLAPRLLEEPGIGPICAAQILISWSHPGRFRSEAAFASLAGVAPIPASSGQVIRHRLNRSGDRQLNRALYTIVLCRLAIHPETRAYAARRSAEGKSPREIKRCLKRFLARRIFKLLEPAMST